MSLRTTCAPTAKRQSTLSTKLGRVLGGTFLSFAILLVLPGAQATSEEVQAGAQSHQPTWGATTSGGSFYVEWAAEPGPLTLNEIGGLRVRVLDPEDRMTPVHGAVVTLNARMPEHNHGLNLLPRVEMNENGSARVSGFLLHMEGLWEVEVGVASDGRMERATFSLEVEP